MRLNLGQGSVDRCATPLPPYCALVSRSCLEDKRIWQYAVRQGGSVYLSSWQI